MALTLDIKVVPSSGRQQYKLKNGQLVCYLKSPPEKGLANKELIKMLAKALKIPQDALSIVAGKTSRKKRIWIAHDITLDQFLAQLGIEEQLRLFD